MTNKRKRENAVASSVEETSETGSTDDKTMSGNILVAERIFEVQVYKDRKSISKKPRIGEWSELLEQKGWEPDDMSIHYRISPISTWDQMKNYTKFVGEYQRAAEPSRLALEPDQLAHLPSVLENFRN